MPCACFPALFMVGLFAELCFPALFSVELFPAFNTWACPACYITGFFPALGNEGSFSRAWLGWLVCRPLQLCFLALATCSMTCALGLGYTLSALGTAKYVLYILLWIPVSLQASCRLSVMYHYKINVNVWIYFNCSLNFSRRSRDCWSHNQGNPQYSPRKTTVLFKWLHL